MNQRDQWRAIKQRYRERHADERCRACCGVRDLRGKRCSMCRARDRERKLPGLEHDTAAHAEMLRAAQRPSSRCRVSGLTADELGEMGYALQVDRRFAYQGYTPDNMQLLAAPLNRLKGRGDYIPAWAVDELQADARKLWDATSDSGHRFENTAPAR